MSCILGAGKTIVALLAALVTMENGFQVAFMAPTEILAEQHFLTIRRLLESSRFRVALLHGRMKQDAKDRVMRAFAAGTVDLLVSTTVIEVGIDVPNASIMVIEHAERFGLSQLHQLRGRVGRGKDPSYCLLIAKDDKSDEARRRLRVMEETTDGFKIAEEDLTIRGPGELLGTQQSGLPDFRVANFFRDFSILTEARQEAFAVITRDPLLSLPEHQMMKETLRDRWQGRLELAMIG
ncbi:MAG: helicase-related protein [Deltaproteobacteria bacterium]|nr:helicase-related protein [Deltaproteobacteria bacterium]